MLGTGILGQSPVAHGFMQSFQQQQHSGGHSYPYSTPLGPLSPYGNPQPTGLPVSVHPLLLIEIIMRHVTSVPTAPHSPNGWVLSLVHTVPVPFLGLPIRISSRSPTENFLPGDFSCPWPPGENSPLAHQTWLDGQHSLQ